MDKVKKQLIQRWQTEPGLSIAKNITTFFFGLQFAGHGKTIHELMTLLDGLPLREEVKEGKDLRGIVLTGGVHELDFSGFDFTFASLEFNFVNCDLSYANFANVDARGSILLKKVSHANFENAKLSGAFFKGAKANNCTFDRANLVQANFEEADLSGSSFNRAQCQKAKFIRSNLSDCNFSGAILKEAVIQEARIDKSTRFKGTNLQGIYHKDLFDKQGNLVLKGIDWRDGSYDETTIFDNS